MAYIGTPPSNAFTSLLKQDFSTSATTGYTLDHAVNNANDIALFINFVRQEPTAGYAASGTTLTLTSATASSDDMYCVYLGQALQTVNPANASVGISQLSATGTKNSTTFLRGDNTFASAGGDNTPYFYGEVASSTTITRNTATKVTGCTNNEVDSDSAFDGTTFTVPSGEGGKYYIELTVTGNFSSIGQDGEEIRALLYKNGSSIKTARWRNSSASGQTIRRAAVTVNAILNLSASDTIELYAFLTDASGGNGDYLSGETSMAGYKLIG